MATDWRYIGVGSDRGQHTWTHERLAALQRQEASRICEPTAVRASERGECIVEITVYMASGT